MAVSSFVESIEYISTSLGSSDTSTNVTLSKGQNYENCVPFVTHTAGEDAFDSTMIDFYFSGTTSTGVINFQRDEDGVEVAISCYIIEFNSEEIRVQQGSFDILAGIGTDYQNLSTTLSGTDRAVVTFGARCSNSSTGWRHNCIRGRVESTSQLLFSREGTSYDINGHWYVFEDLGNNFRVTAVTELISESSETTSVFSSTLNNGECFDLARTFFIASYSDSNDPLSRSAGVFNLFPEARVEINAGQYFTPSINIQAITFLDTTKVYVFFYKDDFPEMSGSSATLSASDFVPNDLEFNPDTSSVVYPHPQSIAAGYTLADSALDECFVQCEEVTSSGVVVNKAGSSYTVNTSNVFVIDWAGVEVDTGTNSSPIEEGTGPGQSFVKSVENFRFTVSDRIHTRVLTKGQDVSNCAVFVSARPNTVDDTINAAFINVYITEPGIVWFNGTPSAEGIVDVSVVEFWAEQVKVQQVRVSSDQYDNISNIGDVTYINYDSYVNLFDIEEVSSINKCILLSNQNLFTNSIAQGDEPKHVVNPRFYSTSSLLLYRVLYSGVSISAPPVNVSLFVIEDLQENFEVSHTFLHVTSANRDHYFLIDDMTCFSKSCFNVSTSINRWGSGGAHGVGCRFVTTKLIDEWSAYFVSTDNSYYNQCYLSTIKFLSNKIHLHQLYDVDLSTDTVVTDNYDSNFSNNITPLNCELRSTTALDGYSTGSSSGFAAIRITDYDTKEYEVSRANNADSTEGAFYIIDWVGYDYTPTISGVLAINSATPTKSVVNSIQKANYTTTDEDVFIETIEYGQNIEKCVPFLNWSIGGASDCRFIQTVVTKDDTHGLFYIRSWAKNQSPSITSRDINLYIVEFNENITVQHGTVVIDTDTVSVDINPVNLDRAFLHFYFYNDSMETASYAWNQFLFTSGYFTSSSGITFERSDYLTSGNDYGGDVRVAWYVVECTEEDAFWEVEHNTQLSGASSNSTPVTLDLTKDFYKTMILGSNAILNDGSSNKPSYSMAYYLVNPYVLDSIQLLLQSNIRNLSPINFEIISFSENSVYTKYFNSLLFSYLIANGDTTETFYINTFGEVDDDRTIILCTKEANYGSMASQYGDNQDGAYHSYSLASSTTIEINREDNQYDTYNSAGLYQFPPFNKYYMEGYVKEIDEPVVREVYAFRSDTGELMDHTVSVSGTGYFYLETSYSGIHHVTCLDNETGQKYNDLIYGNIYPTVISGSFSYNKGWTDNSLGVGIPLFRQ